MEAIKWFYSFLKKYKLKLIIALILVTITSILAIINPYISGMIIDEVIKGGKYEILTTLIVTLISITIVRAILRFTFLMLFETSSQDVLYNMRDSVFKKLLGQDFSFYNKNRTGDLMSRQTGDMDAIRHFVAYVIYNLYENILLFSIALFMIFTVNIKLAFCMIMVLPFTAFNTYIQSKNIKPAFHKIRTQFSSLNAFVQENISGNRVVKAFAKEDFEIQKFTKENDAYRDAELGATAIWSKYVPRFEFLSNTLNFILMLIGSIMVIKGEMSMGNMVTINGYLWMLNNPLRMAGWLTNDVQRFITSVEKIHSTISQEPEIKEPNKAICGKYLEGNIEFVNVNYKTKGDVILNNINFSVKKGQTVGIIGATGSGKSTIMNLMCRFYDVTDGKVLIDGYNVKDLDLHYLREHIGMAMQDVFLFSDTIEGNIAYGRPDCPFDEIKRVAQIASADEFIMGMPDKYDTIVGERGMGLSGGQKQRISLARALLKNPSIIILDDTTSAVDMETEAHIQNELDKLSQECTVFIIAHRISSIKDADIILVLDNGRIVEQGNHDSLIKKKGYYYKVFNHQYGEFDQFIKEGVIA